MALKVNVCTGKSQVELEDDIKKFLDDKSPTIRFMTQSEGTTDAGSRIITVTIVGEWG